MLILRRNLLDNDVHFIKIHVPYYCKSDPDVLINVQEGSYGWSRGMERKTDRTEGQRDKADILYGLSYFKN